MIKQKYFKETCQEEGLSHMSYMADGDNRINTLGRYLSERTYLLELNKRQIMKVNYGDSHYDDE